MKINDFVLRNAKKNMYSKVKKQKAEVVVVVINKNLS